VVDSLPMGDCSRDQTAHRCRYNPKGDAHRLEGSKKVYIAIPAAVISSKEVVTSIDYAGADLHLKACTAGRRTAYDYAIDVRDRGKA
jgi:hypothetical protein